MFRTRGGGFPERKICPVLSLTAYLASQCKICETRTYARHRSRLGVCFFQGFSRDQDPTRGLGQPFFGVQRVGSIHRWLGRVEPGRVGSGGLGG